jgi:hypothetical protein
MCELEVCVLHIQTLPETPSESGVTVSVCHYEPGAISFKCLAQGHVDRFFTLLALRVEQATFRLLAQHR